MNIYEYQGKELFREYGIRVPEGFVIDSPEGLKECAAGGVVKAQVLTGGRGKAGAVRVCDDDKAVKQAVSDILGMKVKGHTVRKVLVEEKFDIKEEYYFSIFINRKKKLYTMMFTDQGGMDIESLPHDKITQVDVNPLLGLKSYMVKCLLAPYKLEKDKELSALINKAFELFMDKSLQLLEINPLARLEDGSIVALDSKVTFDDWAIDESIDTSDQDAGDSTEFEANLAKYAVTAVELDGDIIVMGGGAGAAMATADSIAARGGTLRAIIDLGTLPSDSDDPEDVEYACEALRMLPELGAKVIFFNYYFQAGRLDLEAKTLVKAYEGCLDKLPIVTRYKGRMSEEGRQYLREHNVFTTDSYEEAVEKVLEMAKEGK